MLLASRWPLASYRTVRPYVSEGRMEKCPSRKLSTSAFNKQPPCKVIGKKALSPKRSFLISQYLTSRLAACCKGNQVTFSTTFSIQRCTRSSHSTTTHLWIVLFASQESQYRCFHSNNIRTSFQCVQVSLLLRNSPQFALYFCRCCHFGRFFDWHCLAVNVSPCFHLFRLCQVLSLIRLIGFGEAWCREGERHDGDDAQCD